ncbi:MAG: sigma-70 family RNA polymerase sigma factor [Deltaproteobacteria bacterium]|nr:MAG: sigma-70 family RNA polymerase sigma factor [Deltaproteobacteria bacterium]
MDSEHNLIERAKAGDEGAYQKIVDNYKDQVFRLALGIVRNSQEAEDITQEVFIRVFKSLKSFQYRSLLKTWIFRITINIGKNFLKKRTDALPLEGVEIEDSKPSPLEGTEYREKLEEFMKAIGNLPFKQQTAAILRIQQGLEFKEIARIMKCTLGGARSHYFQALKKLRKSMV